LSERKERGCDSQNPAQRRTGASQQQLIDIVEFLPDATFVIDQDKRVVSWNRAAEEMTGVPKESVLGTDGYAIAFYGEKRPLLIDFLFRPDDDISAIYGAVSRRGSVLHAEGFIPGAYGGRGTHYWGFASLLFDRSGDVVGAVECLRDITEKKRVEEALKVSEEKYRTIFENSIEGIFQTTPDGRYISVNPPLARMMGFASPGEMIAGVTDIAHQHYVNPREREEYKALLNEHGRLEAFETQVYRKDGSVCWVSINARTVRDCRGAILHYEGTLEDISRRKAAEQTLKESEEKYRNIFENAIEGIFQTTPDGQFLTVNPSMARILGYDSPEEMMTTIADVARQIYVDPGDRIKFTSMHQSQGFTEAFETEFYKKNGEKIWVSLTSRAVHGVDDEILCFEGMCEDISLHKKMENELLNRRNLESIGTLAGGIAHDFNNLLTAVTGYASLAEISLSPESKAAKFLKKSVEIAMQGKELTQQLVTFSKGGAPMKERINLAAWMKGVLGAFRAEEKVDLGSAIPDNLLHVEIDEQQFRQVIVNILKNASEAMPEGGKIRVKAANTRICPDDTAALAQGDYVEITIDDTGVGISPEHMQKVFDPYFSTKGMGNKKGTGLGLTIAYSIVRAHNGHIIIESTPGIGTTVHICLPVHTKDGLIPKQTKKEAGATKKRVLFMDDEEALRAVGYEMLTHLGYEALVAEDGHKAVDIYKREMESGTPVNVVILDLVVKSGMGGQEAINRLIRMDPHVKAIVSSGYTDDPVMSRYGEYGFAAAIGKPYTLESLIQVLQKMDDPLENPS
jgi:PAS domain S-box-containing protein